MNSEHPLHERARAGRTTRTGTTRRRVLSTLLGSAVASSVVGPVTAQSTQTGFVDILSADPSEYPEILLNVSVDTAAGRSGELGSGAFTVIEAGTERPIEQFSFTSTAADVVFVFDDTGSMSNEIEAMKNGVTSLTDQIEAAGIDARYALVTFKDDIETDQPFTENASQFSGTVDGLTADGGGDEPEDNFDALTRALDLSYRSGAQKILVDITDSTAHYRGDGSGFSGTTLSEVATRIQNSGVAYIAVAPDIDDDQASKKTLAETVDGLWIDITSASFGRILERIRGLVATAYVVRYVTQLGPDANGRVVCRVDDPAEGEGSDSTSVTIPPDVTPPSDGPGERVFRVMSTDENAEVSYECTVSGSVEKTQLGEGGTAADADDTVRENSDGTVTIVGSTGDGAGDAYLVTGTIDSFERTGGTSGLELFLGGENVTDEYLATEQVFRVMSTDENAEVSYEFTVGGSVEKTQLGEGGTAADADDTVTANSDGTTTVDGSTGDGAGDAYLVTGDIQRFERTGGSSGLELFLDGENVTGRYLGS